jgi:uncharacterized membrane protein
MPRMEVAAGAAGSTGNPIEYHGGPVLLGAVNIYYIWYGDWTGNTATTILTDLANHLGGSPYYAINTTYFDNTGTHVSNSVKFAGSTTDNYSVGTSLTDADVQTVVSNAIAGGRLPLDTNAVYFVLTSADVAQLPAFGTMYCAWHDFGTIQGANIKYVFVGNPQNHPSCSIQNPGPNGNAGADSMASGIVHEFEEAVTDPNFNAWYMTSTAEEIADMCAWTWGTLYYAANGAVANMNLGGRDYLIQQDWVNAGGGYCAKSYSGASDFSLSASPTSQSISAGSATNYAVNIAAVQGFSDNVILSLSGLPNGATSNLGTPATVAPGSSFPMSVNAGAASPGVYPLTVTGTSGKLTHTLGVSLNLTDFTISASPAAVSVATGGNAAVTVAVSPLGGFNGAVTFSVAGLPYGVTTGFSPAAVTTSGSTTIPLVVGSSAAAGNYPITVSGTSGGVTHSTALTLSVTAADFSLAAQTASLSISQRGSANLNLSVKPLKGFTGTVSFSVTGLPAGTSATFAPATVTASGSSTMTLSVSSATTPGTYPLTVAATSGALSHLVNVNLTVKPVGNFSLAVNPTNLKLSRGSTTANSGGVTAVISANGGFNEPINLSISGLPSGAAATLGVNPVTPVSGSSVTSLLNVTVGPNTPTGNYRVNVTGTAYGVPKDTATFTLQVTN